MRLTQRGRLRTWSGRIAPVFLISLLVVLAAGCKAEVTKEVLFINDSVTAQSVGAIAMEMNDVKATDHKARYAPNFGSSVTGIGLKRVPLIAPNRVNKYWDEHLTSLLAAVKPQVIVVELGYNDCNENLSHYGKSIDRFMGHIPSKTPVHWLTMHDANNSFTCDTKINAAIRAATARWSNLSIFDFAAFMKGHGAWTARGGVHLNTAGQQAYAKWLHRQLDAIYDK
jgi:lysophospholipase L1-like esterase